MTDWAENDIPRGGGWLLAAGGVIVLGAVALSVLAGAPFDDRRPEPASAAAASPAPPVEAAPADRRLLRSYTDGAGFACRDFAQPVTIDAEPVNAFGTVCRAADGSWALVGDAAAPPAAPSAGEAAAPPAAPDRSGRERRARTPREAFL